MHCRKNKHLFGFSGNSDYKIEKPRFSGDLGQAM